MAHLAQLSALTSELVTLITSTSPEHDPHRFNAFREASLRALRQHTFARTNQFEVEDRLNGLEERLCVTGRDALADALKDRREQLWSRADDKWTPDILHLLLELSDKPVENVKLRDLDWLYPRLEELEKPPLQWEDIAKEDGWDKDRALWKNANHVASSDDETFGGGSDVSSETGSTSPSSDDMPQPEAMSGVGTTQVSMTVLSDIQSAQSWRYKSPPTDSAGRHRKIAAPELQILREVLWMLQGLETTLFDAKCVPNLAYQLSDVSWGVYKHIITAISEHGRRLIPLRRHVILNQAIPLLQVFQGCIRQKLGFFDRLVTDIQSRFVAIHQDTVISLAAVVEELTPHITLLHSLATIIDQLHLEQNAHAFRYLELLYDGTCMAQLEGKDAVYSFLGGIFLHCFQVYLRPIRSWMEEGELVPGDKIFFAASAKEKVPLSQMWQHQYRLRRTEKGVLHAPRFLETTALKIFTTGKSVVMLKQLGQYEMARSKWEDKGTGFDSVYAAMANEPSAPFSELFGDAFDRWIRSKHHAASTDLRKLLFESCGLWSSLDAMQSVYLMSQGSLTDAFAFRVFENIDTGNKAWRDRFALTEMLQEVFSSQPYSYRLSATTTIPAQNDNLSALRTIIPSIKPTLSLSWPVQLVITSNFIEGYQAVFTLLLQIKRAYYTLTRHQLRASIYNESTPEDAAYYALRTRLIWFCTTLMSYLTTQVLSPLTVTLRADLHAADDVDGMVAAHERFVKAIVAGACLGEKLTPIRECVLDLLGLCGHLEDARVRQSEREDKDRMDFRRSMGAVEEEGEVIRVYVNPVEEEEEEATMLLDSDDDENDKRKRDGARREESYADVLRSVRADFDRHLRFIAGGLRGVARASTDGAAGKWDVLAETLETGIRNVR